MASARIRRRKMRPPTRLRAKDRYRWLESVPEPERFVEIAGWFVVVGSTMALLGFLLPWSRVVIGASTIGGYFDGWGLASPTHLLVFVSLLGVLALALRRGPLSPWISSGILGLVFGGLLLGLAWPYLVGPLGADVGLTMTALGAVALLIGGVVDAVGDPSRGGRTSRLKARRPNGGSDRPPATLRRTTADRA